MLRRGGGCCGDFWRRLVRLKLVNVGGDDDIMIDQMGWFV